MGCSSFHKGVEIIINDIQCVILKKLPDGLFQIEEVNSGTSLSYSLEQLLKLYISKSLTFKSVISFTNNKPLSFEKRLQYIDISDKQWNDAKIKLLYVKECLYLANSEKVLKPVIHDLWKKTQIPQDEPHPSSVKRWKRKYIDSGNDFQSLIERHDKKGNRSIRYNKKINTIIDNAIDRIYLNKERGTVQDTLDETIFQIEKENNLLPDGFPPISTPSFNYVKSKIEEISAYDRCVARYGYTEATMRYRHIKGHIVTNEVLERIEIDHTPFDVMVVHHESHLPLGRPYLTAMIDSFTRCIVGVYIGFIPPSYLSVSHCFKHALLPKLDLNKKYPSIENSWCAYGVPQQLVVDNGLEFHSTSLEQACLSLGVELHYAARKKGWMKPYIEKMLGFINHSVVHRIPGTTFSNIFEKNDYDPKKTAMIDLQTLSEIVNKWIVDYYHQKPHGILKISPQQSWEENIQQENILLPNSISALDVIMGKTDTRILTHKGIEYDSLLYNCPELGEIRRNVGEKLEVTIKVDESDLSHIYVISPNEKLIIDVPALNREYTKNLSAFQHKYCKKLALEKYHNKSNKSYLKAKHDIKNMIEEAFFNHKKRTRKKEARHEDSSRNESNRIENQASLDAKDDLEIQKSNFPELINNKDDFIPIIPNKTKSFEPIIQNRGQHIIDIDQEDNG